MHSIKDPDTVITARTDKTKDEDEDKMKDLTQVNGIAVIAREPVSGDAMSNDPVLSQTKVGFKTVQRVLLEDESTLYQCMHPNNDDCVYTADNVKSVLAHQKSHSATLEAKRLAAELAAIQARQEQTRRNRSEGSRKGHAARQQRATADTETTTESTSSPAALAAQYNKAIQRVTLTANALDDAIDAHRKEVLNLIKLVKANPTCDPQIIAKAQQYDALKAAFGQMK